MGDMPAALVPQDQFPRRALENTVQDFPPSGTISGDGLLFTWNIASATDAIMPWGNNVAIRDRQLRDFWPTETYLAGAVASIGMRNATFDWEIRGPSEKVTQAVTDMLLAALAGESFGWVQFIKKFSQDLNTQDNGAFIELIRDPGRDANSRFKNENAPVIGINHLDAGQCIRTGNPDFPVVYTDRKGKRHKLAWFQIIPFSDFPSSIESMHGVGYCSVTRVIRMAQIVKNYVIFKDEKISGRHFKQIHFVSGVSRQDIKDEMKRGQEEANNSGLLRFILPAILASLDPEKPVTTASIDLASLPDNFNFDEEMRWYISGMALGFGVDYQEFAPLASGNIGSSAQSMILHRKSSGKSPAVFMRTLTEGLKAYGAFPRGYNMHFNDKDEQEELEKQEVRIGALEEMAIAVNSQILTPEAAARELVRRGIWEEDTISKIPDDYWERVMDQSSGKNQPVGSRGGNTILEDSGRQETGKPNLTGSRRLTKG